MESEESISRSPKVIVLEVPDVKQNETLPTSEEDSYRSVGTSIKLAIGESIDVTRMDRESAALIKSVREECESGLSVFLEENQVKTFASTNSNAASSEEEHFVWSYLLTPSDAKLTSIVKKCSAVANITILFRGRADDGILSIVDSAYLTLNDKVIDIASMAPNQEDKRVATFRGFPESNPFLFSCMSKSDELKIFIRFKARPSRFGREMIRILADLFSFESQDEYLHQSWIVPLRFDSSQELFYDCSGDNPVLLLRGDLGASPQVLSKRASRGWPHELSDSESDSCESESDESDCSEMRKRKEKENEWRRRMEMELQSREKAKHTISLMEQALRGRGRAYSDEDVFHIQRLFGVSFDKGMSAEAEALCAIEIARWKAQKKLLDDEMVKLVPDTKPEEKEKEKGEDEEKVFVEGMKQ